MARRTMLDGIGLLFVNFGGGFALSFISMYLSGLSETGGGNLGFGLMWIYLLPILIVVYAFFLWILQSIFIWIHESRKNKNIVVVGLGGSFLVLLLPFLLSSLHFIGEWYWSLVISLLMAIGSFVLVVMRMQLWAEQAMLEQSRREDAYWRSER